MSHHMMDFQDLATLVKFNFQLLEYMKQRLFKESESMETEGEVKIESEPMLPSPIRLDSRLLTKAEVQKWAKTAVNVRSYFTIFLRKLVHISLFYRYFMEESWTLQTLFFFSSAY